MHLTALIVQHITWGKNAKFGIVIEEELEPTLVAKGAGAVAHPNSSQRTEKTRLASDCDETASVNATEPEYIVRRLTPTECAGCRIPGLVVR